MGLFVIGKLVFANVSSLWSTSSLLNIKCYILAFFKSLEAFALDSWEMNEYVISTFALDETETFFCIKPFYFTVFHVCCLPVCNPHILLLFLLIVYPGENQYLFIPYIPNKNNSFII